MSAEHASGEQQTSQTDASLTGAAALFQRLISDYLSQASCVGELAKTEAKLSAKALLLTVGLIVAIAMSAIVVWLSLLGASAYLLYLIWDSVLISAAVIIILQGLLIRWLLGQLGPAIERIGFSRTLNVISSTTQQEQSDASEATS
ncbi:phage holin family protein [Pseudoalteromonas sp. GB56]